MPTSSAVAFSEKYSGAFPEKIQSMIQKGLDDMLMVQIEIEHMTGKEAIELVSERKQTQA